MFWQEKAAKSCEEKNQFVETARELQAANYIDNLDVEDLMIKPSNMKES